MEISKGVGLPGRGSGHLAPNDPIAAEVREMDPELTSDLNHSVIPKLSVCTEMELATG